MGEVSKAHDENLEDNVAKRRLTLTRLLIWAEREAASLGRDESARHINLAVGQLFDDPPQ